MALNSAVRLKRHPPSRIHYHLFKDDSLKGFLGMLGESY